MPYYNRDQKRDPNFDNYPYVVYTPVVRTGVKLGSAAAGLPGVF